MKIGKTNLAKTIGLLEMVHPEDTLEIIAGKYDAELVGKFLLHLIDPLASPSAVNFGHFRDGVKGMDYLALLTESGVTYLIAPIHEAQREDSPSLAFRAEVPL